MKAIKRHVRTTPLMLAIAGAGLMPLAAGAQSASMADMQARYKEDLQRCETLTDPESKATCRREAGAALQEARRNRLATPQADTSANAAARCARLPSDQRADCERLMSDGSAVKHGSVTGGGVLREMTITVPAGTPGAATSSTYSSTPSAPVTTYGSQPAPAPGSTYGTQPAPATTYGSQPAPGGTYQAPPATGGYGAQPAPTPGVYGTQPAR